MNRDQLEYNLCWVSDHYSPVVDEASTAESSHNRMVRARMMRVVDSESKVSAAVEAEMKTRKTDSELTNRFACEDTERARITDARARVVASVDGLDINVKAIVVWMGQMMDELWADLSGLIRDGPRGDCEERINLAHAEFTAASVDISAASVACSATDSDVVLLRGGTHMDLDFVLSGSDRLPAKAADAGAAEEAVADRLT